jgi:hypothetical protein
VIQQVAANTEESAGVSREMHVQAREMRNSVETLVTLVGGTEKAGKARGTREDNPSPGTATPTAHPGPARRLLTKSTNVREAKSASPDHAIQLAEGDFQDF